MAIALAVDANVLFSAMLADGKTRRLIQDSRLKLCAPAYLFEEIGEHLQNDAELVGKLNRTKEDTEKKLHRFREFIEVAPLEEYGNRIPLILKDCPDPFDAPYFALASQRNIPLWSNDKRLKRQAIVKVLNTQEILRLLEQGI